MISQLPQTLKSVFENMTEFDDAEFTTQFTRSARPAPLTRPLVVFGYDRASVTQTGESATFTMTLHAPKSYGYSGIASLACVLAEELISVASPPGGVKMSAITYDRIYDSLRVVCSFDKTEQN